MVMVLQKSILSLYSAIIYLLSSQPVIIIHEAKYFIVTSASIIIRPKIYQFHARDHTKFTTLNLSICHSLQNVHFLDAEDDSNFSLKL